MKTLLRISKSILIYFLCYILVNIFFCGIYYFCELKELLSWHDIFIYSLLGNLGNLMKRNEMLLLLSAQQFVEMLCTTVLTGYIFAYILNREPKILLPDKLIIRHRTSENVEKLLTLGVMVGNKNRFKIHDVRCTVSCCYLKSSTDSRLTNSDFQITEEVYSIDNFYRFSFPLKRFPRKILQDFLNKDPRCLEIDTIRVSVSGHSNMIGNAFLVSKKYKLSDLVIDEHMPDAKNAIKNPITKKKMFEFIRWDELFRIEEVGEDERQKTIDEIRQIFS